jgi:hypothetical protein
VPETNITSEVEPADAAPRLGRFDAEAQKTAAIAGVFSVWISIRAPRRTARAPDLFFIAPALSLGGDVRFDLLLFLVHLRRVALAKPR